MTCAILGSSRRAAASAACSISRSTISSRVRAPCGASATMSIRPSIAARESVALRPPRDPSRRCVSVAAPCVSRASRASKYPARQKWRFSRARHCAGTSSAVDQSAEQCKIADLHVEIVEPGCVQRLHRERHDLDLAGSAILQAEQFRTGLEKLRRAMRLVRLMTESQAVVGNPLRKRRTRIHRHFADRDGEIRAQAKVAPRRIGERKRPPTDFFARAVEENVRRLQHARFLARIAARREAFQDRDRLRVECVDGRGVVSMERQA